jgi:predicted Zn-dependent protease
MEEKPIPIYVMRASDVTLEEKEAIMEAIREVIEIADSPRKKEIVDLDCWKAEGYKDENGNLVPGKSIDWLFETSFNKERGQVITTVALAESSQLELKNERGSYYVFITGKDLYKPDEKRQEEYVLGEGSPVNHYALISVHRLKEVKNVDYREGVKQIAHHEVGHAMGLLPADRTKAVEKAFGDHCTNDNCAMRRRRNMEEFERFTQERLESGKIYCEQCTNDLKKVKIELKLLHGDFGKAYWKDYRELEQKFEKVVDLGDVPAGKGYLEREHRVNILALSEGKPVGFIRLDMLNQPPRMGWLYVEEEFRKKPATLENTPWLKNEEGYKIWQHLIKAAWVIGRRAGNEKVESVFHDEAAPKRREWRNSQMPKWEEEVRLPEPKELLEVVKHKPELVKR